MNFNNNFSAYVHMYPDVKTTSNWKQNYVSLKPRFSWF